MGDMGRSIERLIHLAARRHRGGHRCRSQPTHSHDNAGHSLRLDRDIQADIDYALIVNCLKSLHNKGLVSFQPINKQVTMA